MTTTDRDSSRSGPQSAAGSPVTAEDLTPGTLVAVPAGEAGRQRPFCLRITEKTEVSQATGAVTVHGNVLGADGATTRRKPLPRRIVTSPWRLTILQRPDSSAEPANVDVQPSRTQIALMHIPPGILVRLWYWDPGGDTWAVREMRDLDHPTIMLAPGDYEGIGWHVRHRRYSDLRTIEQGGRVAGQDTWRAAARRVQDGGVVYLQLEQQAVGGRRPAWVATEVIDGPALSASRPGHQG